MRVRDRILSMPRAVEAALCASVGGPGGGAGPAAAGLCLGTLRLEPTSEDLGGGGGGGGKAAEAGIGGGNGGGLAG